MPRNWALVKLHFPSFGHWLNISKQLLARKIKRKTAFLICTGDLIGFLFQDFQSKVRLDIDCNEFFCFAILLAYTL